jgi:hypothetical protein
MYVSYETPEQTHVRLLKVIAQAEFKIYEGTYVFDEFPLVDFPLKANADALALVRDEEGWSQLTPSRDSDEEPFKVFSFHFPERLDNSGFVGWLAWHLKQTCGTGIFVVCGQNRRRGGIFDYWGCPLAVADSVVWEIRKLIDQGKEMVETM